MATRSLNDVPYQLPPAVVPGCIGVVTVTYNSGEVLQDFLASIKIQEYSNFVIYAVDNASRDNTLPELSRWADPRLVVIANKENLGVAAGNNQGIRAAIADGCQYVLLLNNDVTFEADLFQRLLDGLVAHDCAMTTPLIYLYQPRDVIWCAGGYFQPWLAYRNLHFGENEKDTGQFNQERIVTYTPTCCVLIRREVFACIGLMDERYFVYSDDTDFMLRAVKAKQVLYYLPKAKLWHKVNGLTGTASPFSMRFGARNRAFFIAKHLRRAPAIFFQALYYVYYFLQFAFGKDTRSDYRIKRMAWVEGVRIKAHAD